MASSVPPGLFNTNPAWPSHATATVRGGTTRDASALLRAEVVATLFPEHADRLAHLHHRALRRDDLDERSGRGRLDGHDGLVGLDLADALVLRDLVADLLEPVDDLA